jgi:RNA polymerase sigma factor (sigma-70 family)
MHVLTVRNSRILAAPSVVKADPAGLPSEADDLTAATHGDVEAFGRVYRAHAQRIHMLARQLVGSHSADEATQDVFVRAWTKLGSYRGEAQFGTWLHRLAVNVLIRYAQSARRREQRDADLAPELEGRASSDPHVRIDLDTALSAVGESLRQVVVLHDMEGYSHEEIAVLLGITVSASRMRLSRARMALRAFLIEHE